MAVDVSKIPNNNKFDPVREAILSLKAEIEDTGAAIGNGTITINTSGALTGQGTFTTNQTGPTTITIGLDDSSYLTEEVNDLTVAVTWANVPDANITQSSVTQHEAALSITESQISDLQDYALSTSLDDYLYLPETGNQTMLGSLTISGDLTVSGTTTYINTDHLNIGDNIITLNADLPATTAPTENAGIEINRGSATDVSFLWDETADRWTLGSNDLLAGTFFGDLSGTNVYVNRVEAGANDATYIQLDDARVRIYVEDEVRFDSNLTYVTTADSFNIDEVLTAGNETDDRIIFTGDQVGITFKEGTDEKWRISQNFTTDTFEIRDIYDEATIFKMVSDGDMILEPKGIVDINTSVDILSNLTVQGTLTADVTGTVSSLSNHTTDALDEGTTNLYYTTARFNTNFDSKDTDDLDEGATNLYFTTARARGAFSNGTGVTITNGQIAIGQSVGTTDDVQFGEVTADLFSGDGSNLTNVPVTATLDDITTNGNTTTNAIGVGNITSSGNRDIFISSSAGSIRIDGSSGGWSNGYFFNNNSGTFVGGFGAFGGADTLNYFWIGDNYNDASLTIDPSQGDVDIVAGDLQIGGTTVIDSSRNIVNAGSISASGIIGNLTNGSLGQQMEKGDASQTTLRFDANRWRLYSGVNAGEIFTAQEDGKIGVNTFAPKTKFDVNGTIYGQQKVLDGDTTVPNPNLLDAGSIKISGRDDIYGNATKTVISDYEATYDNSTGSTTIRLYVDNGILVNGETYTISLYYKDLEGDLSMDFCDVGLTGAYRNASGTSSNPTSGRIYGYATRSAYDSTYRFVDINLSTGGRVTLLHPKVELGNIVTDFVHEERTDVQPQDLVTNNITTTGNIISLGNISTSNQITGGTIAADRIEAAADDSVYIQLENDRLRIFADSTTKFDTNLTYLTSADAFTLDETLTAGNSASQDISTTQRIIFNGDLLGVTFKEGLDEKWRIAQKFAGDQLIIRDLFDENDVVTFTSDGDIDFTPKGNVNVASNLQINGTTVITSNRVINAVQINASDYLQTYGVLYTRNDLNVLNAAGNGWHTWADRVDGTYNLNVGSVQAKHFTTDGNAKSYTWRPVNNTSTNSGYFKIARITATHSTRFIIELAGRSTSYSNPLLPAMGYIVGQLNNDNDYDIVFYNHASSESEVVSDVGQVDVSDTATDIYIQLGQYAEIVANASISDGTITTYSTSSAETLPSGYTSANQEYKVWNSGNDGELTLDYITDNGNSTTNTITVSGLDQSFIADWDIAGNYWSGRIISKNDTTGVASFLGTYNGSPGVFAHNSALNAWNSIFINTLSTTGNGNANVYTGTLYINGNTAWHAGNDGAGSTLDADLLDGLQGSQYLRSDTNSTFTGNLTINGNLSFTGDSRYIDLSGGTTSSQNALIIGEQNAYGVKFQWDSGAALRFYGFWATSTSGVSNRDLGYVDVNIRTWYLNNIVQVSGSVYAPIYYDSDNSSYYVNPAATSNINALTVGALTVNGRNWAGSIGSGQNYVASSTSTSNRGNYGAGVWSYSGFSTGTNRPHTYDATLQVMPTDNYGFELSADWIATNKTALKIRSLRDCCQGWSTWQDVMTAEDVVNGNFYIETGSMRSPIYYSYNDTTYYVDPNSLSVLNELIIRCDSRSSSDTTTIFRLDGNYIDGRWAHRFRKEDLGGGVPLFIDFSSTTANSYTALARFGSYSGNTYEFEVFGDGKFNGALQTVGDIDAGVYTVRSTNFRASNAYYLGNTNFYLNSDGSGWYSNVKIQSADSLRAPIFYDSDNTSYYLNPTGTSFLNGDLNISSGYLTVAKGHSDTRFELLYDHSSDSGDAQILLWASEPGITYHGSGIGANINFSGQYYGRRTNAIAYGLYMRFDPSNGSTYFGDTTGTAGATGGQGNTNFQIDAAGNTFSLGSSRSPIFYDYGNTAYYINADATSNLYNLELGGAKNTYLYITPGNGYEAMVRFNGGSGSTWYVGSRTSTQLIGSTDAWHVYSQTRGATVSGTDNEGNTFARSSSRAPIFYDLDNTIHYCDPANTSYLNAVSLGAQTWRSNITWNTGVNIVVSGECSIDMYGGQFGVWNSNTQTWSILCPHEGQVEIGQAGSRGLKVFGTITATADVIAYSDIRTKENVKTIDNALEKVSNLRGVEYNRIGETDKKIGVIAQEIEQILPEVVTEDGEGMKAVSYGNIVGVLIEAIKEQQKQIDELKSLINK